MRFCSITGNPAVAAPLRGRRCRRRRGRWLLPPRTRQCVRAVVYPAPGSRAVYESPRAAAIRFAAAGSRARKTLALRPPAARHSASIACGNSTSVYNPSGEMMFTPQSIAWRRHWATARGDYSVGRWLRDIWDAVSTVACGMWVTLRYWFKTYEPGRRTFTERF